jgi:hypothetical protein
MQRSDRFRSCSFGNAAIFIGEPLRPTAAVSAMARSWPPRQWRITVSV